MCHSVACQWCYIFNDHISVPFSTKTAKLNNVECTTIRNLINLDREGLNCYVYLCDFVNRDHQILVSSHNLDSQSLLPLEVSHEVMWDHRSRPQTQTSGLDSFSVISGSSDCGWIIHKCILKKGMTWSVIMIWIRDFSHLRAENVSGQHNTQTEADYNFYLHFNLSQN